MRSIQMVDTKTQYLKIKPQVDKAVIDVIDSTAFINGQTVKDFSANLSAYIGSKAHHSLCKWYRCHSDCFNGAGFKTWR